MSSKMTAGTWITHSRGCQVIRGCTQRKEFLFRYHTEQKTELQSQNGLVAKGSKPTQFYIHKAQKIIILPENY